jgi:hypothetical protein
MTPGAAMAKVNITQAAKMAGVSRGTIHNHIKSGKLSTEKTADGKPVIDVSELLRVFPNLVTPGTPKSDSTNVHASTSQIIIILNSQIERLQRDLDDERRARERDVDYYRREHDRLMSLIENSRLLPKPEEGKRGWLRRWFT